MLKTFIPEGLTAKITTTLEEKIQVAQLRYQVYAIEKGYINRNPFLMDMDDYDEFVSAYFACFNQQNEIVGTMRLIQRPGRFMIDPGKEFENIGGGVLIGTEQDSCELSRLAVKKGYDDGWAVLLMYKVFVQYAIDKGIRYVYSLKDVKETNKLRQNFGPVTRLKGPAKMRDGTMIELSVIDLEEITEYCAQHKPELFEFLSLKNTSPVMAASQ